MGYLTSQPGWADISLNLDTGHVFVQEKWHYEWMADRGATAWTQAEKKAFHALVDQQIWSVWSSGQFRLRVRGRGEFVRKFPTTLPVTEFDVKWVLTGGHWQVRARKTLPSAQLTRDDDSDVKFRERQIVLTKRDVAAKSVGEQSGGSGVGASTTARDDDQPSASTNLADLDSIMNIGRKIRERHLAELVAELNKMVPGVSFYL